MSVTVRIYLMCLFAVTACSTDAVNYEDTEPQSNDLHLGQGTKSMLPAYPLPGERGSGKADEFSDYRYNNPSIYGITNAPKTPMRAVSQWESNQQGLLLTWTGSFPKTVADIVKAAKPVVPVYLVHEGAASKQDFQSAMSQNGVSTSGITFLNMYLDSIWMRDYGPLSVRSPSGEVSFVDPKYYHQRVYDDALPTKIAKVLGINTYRQPLSWEGGTYISDGYGNCYYSQGVYQYGGVSAQQIHKYQKAYLGCDTNIVMKPLVDEGTTHSDMFSKLASKNTMILGKYQSWQDSINKKTLDDNNAILKSSTLNDGTTLTVKRIPMPSNNGKSVWRTYVNALFVNGVNLIPTYTDETTYQAEAFNVWKSVMPAWQHTSIDSTKLIQWSGAVHCITMTIPAGKLVAAETAPKYLCNGSYSCKPSDTAGGTCSLKYEGCCNGNVLNQCKNGAATTIPCGSQSCGWSNKLKAYACGGTGSGPTNAPLACTQNCQPNCNNKECGSDQCGGSCGSCNDAETCQSGQCVKSESSCGDITYQGCCDGNTLNYCDDESLKTLNCNNCGWDSSKGFYNCGFSSAEPTGKYPKNCKEECQPQCVNKQCGTDGCGGTCGTCSSGQTCSDIGKCVSLCVPKCENKQCGPDGCGSTCGSCATNTTCNNGQCVNDCAPKCSGKACGPDGCGGTCGTCSNNTKCQSGQCIEESSSDCGNIGFGGICNGTVLTWCENDKLSTYDCADLGDYQCKIKVGTNPPEYDCMPVTEQCTPNCSNKVCGSDGCNGICGTCSSGSVCEAQTGQCVDQANCMPDCTGKKCGDDGCGNVCGVCGAGLLCQGYICVDPNAPCMPSCDGKACGNNGCGGICGACTNGMSCSETGQCVNEACIPNCTNKVCGYDGCNGTCGMCEVGTVCDGTGACVSGNQQVTGQGMYNNFARTNTNSSATDSGSCSVSTTNRSFNSLGGLILVLMTLGLLGFVRVSGTSTHDLN